MSTHTAPIITIAEDLEAFGVAALADLGEEAASWVAQAVAEIEESQDSRNELASIYNEELILGVRRWAIYGGPSEYLVSGLVA